MAMDRRTQGEPPQITTSDDILAKLRLGVQEVYEVHMRGATFPVRILSCVEVNKIRQEANRMNLLRKGDETDTNVEIQKMTLRLATTVPKGSAPYLSEAILDALTVDELTYLFNEFIGVMEKVNPTIESISGEEFKAIVDALKKNAISPRDLSIHQRNAICTSFVDLMLRLEAQKLPQDN
jgi:hypothetical protein